MESTKGIGNKKVLKICSIVLAIVLLIGGGFVWWYSSGNTDGMKSDVGVTLGYENRLFDAKKVHTIDIQMSNWDEFIDACEDKEYRTCTVVVDGETFSNVGIRAKGNTSLRSVAQTDGERYSFKVEFDCYNDSTLYYGLDKLSLNNLIYDNTCMKDFLTYQMMDEFGADAPLSSYVYITVNGEDWGLYLAVEGVEQAFLKRNYGMDYGELYKPDTDSNEGEGKGGRGNFKGVMPDSSALPEMGKHPEMGERPEMGARPEMGERPEQGEFGERPEKPEGAQPPDDGGFDKQAGHGGFSGFGGKGSSDVKLQYIDDNFESYSNIFDNAQTNISDNDKKQLIESLKNISNNEKIEESVDIDEVIRYFVVHNFVVNGDSYTGGIVHNYYLYEKSGQLSMIPWDYNLAFGTFQNTNASSAVNDPIESPLSVSSATDRPMMGWILSNEEYTAQYKQYFADFVEMYFGEGGKLEQMISNTKELIAPYVKKDPTKFCEYKEFQTGVNAIKKFCKLRAESVSKQLDGEIPTTKQGQMQASEVLVNTGELDLADMGTMNMGRGMKREK